MCWEFIFDRFIYIYTCMGNIYMGNIYIYIYIYINSDIFKIIYYQSIWCLDVLDNFKYITISSSTRQQPCIVGRLSMLWIILSIKYIIYIYNIIYITKGHIIPFVDIIVQYEFDLYRY